MNDLNLSKSKYCKCIQCPKILWLKKYKPEVAIPSEKDAVFENGKKVGEFAKGLFGEYENIEYNSNLNIMIEKTNELLKNNPNIITEYLSPWAKKSGLPSGRPLESVGPGASALLRFLRLGAETQVGQFHSAEGRKDTRGSRGGFAIDVVDKGLVFLQQGFAAQLEGGREEAVRGGPFVSHKA